MAGTKRMTAVPPEVSCAVPRTAEFTQKGAEASQKVTKPGDTDAPKSVVTVAVKVTTVPLATEEEDKVRSVVVDVPKAKLAGVAVVAKSKASTVMKTAATRGGAV
jgi:hypothetical protein